MKKLTSVLTRMQEMLYVYENRCVSALGCTDALGKGA